MLRIKQLRESKNYSQDKMVELTGIPKRSYVNYENELTDIPFSKLQKIASVLNVPIQELIESSEVNNSHPAEPGMEYSEKEISLKKLRQEIREDLKVVLTGMQTNFETISEGIYRGLRNDEKILNFIEDLDEAGINNACRDLNKFLKEH